MLTREAWVESVAGVRGVGGKVEKLSGKDHTALCLAFYSKWHDKPFEDYVKRSERA